MTRKMLLPRSTLLATACFIWHTLGSPILHLVHDSEGRSTISPTLPSSDSSRIADPIPPTRDPWYTAPHDFAKAKPGTVLRIREAPGNLTSLVDNCSATYNILYRTTNSRYLPDWAVTTVFVPATKAPALLSYQIPYDSASLDASPSYAFYGSDLTTYLADISTGLSNGWFVSSPDYEGPLASFTAGVESGHATIDSVRAVMGAYGKLGLAKDARYAMWGYSGGALASEWAAELQVQYAPELNFSGAALGGLTPNVTSVALMIDGSISAGLAPSSVLGISSQYPKVRDYLVSRLKTEGPRNATGFLAALNYTLDEAIAAYAFQHIGDYFIGGISDLFGPIPTKITNSDGIMGFHGVPQMPLFAYKAIADEISNVTDTDALVDKYCTIGANVLYQRNTVGGHSAEFINGRPAALAWLTSVLNGTYASSYSTTGCTTEVVTVNITDSPLKRRDIRRFGWWLGDS